MHRKQQNFYISRRDTYHYLVKSALIKEGWTISHDPYFLLSDPKLSIDLGAEKTIAAEKGYDKIAVEVKSFIRDSQVTELEKAVGQYGIYEELLKTQEPDRELYLAVPIDAFENIFSRQVGKIAIEKFSLKLIVFYFSEEDLLWIVP
ncbi:MAG: element excision factor XisH family protein [Cyanobacteriota bacterium]|nr:element excision factor XisH family protein [Cyanobacteriota bacterium]